MQPLEGLARKGSAFRGFFYSGGEIVDDKCHKCGDWTPKAYARYGGLFNDGSAMEQCECVPCIGGCDCEDCESTAESRVWDEAIEGGAALWVNLTEKAA